MDIRVQRSPGPTVTIHCPVCNARDVSAESYEQLEHLRLFYVIPLLKIRNTFVRCSACAAESIAEIGIEEIGSRSADELVCFLAGRVSLVSRFLAIVSILLFWVPLVGLALSVCALLANRRTIGWPKAVSIVATVLAAIFTGIGVIALSLNR